MDVVSLSPLRTGALLWRPAPDRWMLTVVCKATYALAHGESGLAVEQDDVNEREGFWDDSLHTPCDLVPFKRKPDVVLVGHAFAPRGQAVRSLVARLVVGKLDKSLTIHGDRTAGKEGTPFVKMPLRYERGVGGPGTWNPVGIAPSAPGDALGRRPLPNIVVPSAATLAGFGPIASSWPLRSAKLGARGATWSSTRLSEEVIGDDFDAGFFQVAPPEQQVEALHEDEAIVLENLHADHARLTTRLAGVRPRVFVEPAAGADRQLAMTADTLWIDTNRAVCTVTWRGLLRLDHREQRGRLLVLIEKSDQPVTWSHIALLADVRQGESFTRVMHDPPVTQAAHERANSAVPTGRQGTVTMTLDGPPTAHTPVASADPSRMASVPAAARPASPALLRPLAGRDRGGRAETGGVVPGEPRRPLPSPPRAAPSRAPAVSLPSPTHADAAPPSTPAPASIGQAAAAVPAQSFEASLKPHAKDLVELLWANPGLEGKLERHEAWRELAAQAKPPDVLDEGLEGGRRAVLAVLLKAPTVGCAGALRAFNAVGDESESAFSPPLVVLAGEIEVLFDEQEAFKATLAAAWPPAAKDDAWRTALQGFQGMLRDVGDRPPAVEELTAELRAAFAKSKPDLGERWLDLRAARVLLQQRCHQKRWVLGQQWLRCLFRGLDEDRALPAYLPECLSLKLPSFRRLRVRMLAEAAAPVDQDDPPGCALKVVALARVIRLAVDD